MNKYCVLFNPFSANGKGRQKAEAVKIKLNEAEIRFVDKTAIKDMKSFFASLPEDEKLILAGGDGTLNRFINDEAKYLGERKLYYYPSGTGNDFWNDLGKTAEDGPSDITEYIQDLPTITVNGMERLFINGIGYGIDGYCCEEADRLKAKDPNRKISYTTIALFGLLYKYKPTNAVITVDGKTKEYKKVWLAPGMKGRYFGGGMMPTPAQERRDPEGRLSNMVFYGYGKLRTLLIFPKIFTGKHVSYTEACEVRQGREITVRFDRPVALQIDGETVLNVTTYTVRAAQKNK